MKIIDQNIKNVYEIKKSKFIVYLSYVKDISEINNLLDELSNKYSDATHICYAYKINNIIKCSDDNEPSGTAGIPILEVLNKNDLNYIIAVVIRYFGGIKLGAGGLIRAYSNSVIDTLKLVNIINLTSGYKVKITTDYNNIKKLDYILKNEVIIEKIFKEKIIYIIELNKNKLNLINEFDYTILEDIMIKEN